MYCPVGRGVLDGYPQNFPLLRAGATTWNRHGLREGTVALPEVAGAVPRLAAVCGKSAGERGLVVGGSSFRRKWPVWDLGWRPYVAIGGGAWPKSANPGGLTPGSPRARCGLGRRTLSARRGNGERPT